MAPIRRSCIVVEEGVALSQVHQGETDCHYGEHQGLHHSK